MLKVNGNTIEHNGQKVCIDRRNNIVSFIRPGCLGDRLPFEDVEVMTLPLDDKRLDEVIAKWLGVELDHIVPILAAFD